MDTIIGEPKPTCQLRWLKNNKSKTLRLQQLYTVLVSTEDYQFFERPHEWRDIPVSYPNEGVSK